MEKKIDYSENESKEGKQLVEIVQMLKSKAQAVLQGVVGNTEAVIDSFPDDLNGDQFYYDLLHRQLVNLFRVSSASETPTQLFRVPLVDSKSTEKAVQETAYIPQKFLRIPLGDKAKTIVKKYKLVTYTRYPNDAVFLYARSPECEPGRGYFIIALALSLKPNLADQLVEHIEANPKDISVIAQHLFPGTAQKGQYINRKGGKLSTPHYLIERSVQMLCNVSGPELKKTGFEFDTPYLSREDDWYKRIIRIYDGKSPQEFYGGMRKVVSKRLGVLPEPPIELLIHPKDLSTYHKL